MKNLQERYNEFRNILINEYNFVVRIEHDVRSVFLYSEENQYTNCHINYDGKYTSFTNIKSKYEKDIFNWCVPEETKGLKINRGGWKQITSVGYETTNLIEFKNYLNKLLPHLTREKKLKRILNEVETKVLK
jgi:hypothetical protein